MKVTISIIAAALATISSAASLPEKFELKFTGGGAALAAFNGKITVDKFYGQFLNIGTTSNQPQAPAILYSDGNGGAIYKNTNIIPGQIFNQPLIGPKPGFESESNYMFLLFGELRPPYTTATFTQTNNVISFNGRTEFSACPSRVFSSLFEVYPTNVDANCIPITLVASPL